MRASKCKNTPSKPITSLWKVKRCVKDNNNILSDHKLSLLELQNSHISSVKNKHVLSKQKRLHLRTCVFVVWRCAQMNAFALKIANLAQWKHNGVLESLPLYSFRAFEMPRRVIFQMKRQFRTLKLYFCFSSTFEISQMCFVGQVCCNKFPATVCIFCCCAFPSENEFWTQKTW